jgi:hypothetical protein
MRFTNSYSLPDPLVHALQGDQYDLKGAPSNIISVTTLISPPKQKILEARHDAEIEIDVSERLWMLLGTACHEVVEKATSRDDLSEERWFLDTTDMMVYTMPANADLNKMAWYVKDHLYVSGKLDLYEASTKKLSDYKITSVWSWLLEKKMKPEHAAQLNINAYALMKIGFPVLSLSIMAMFRDWSKTKSKNDYPDLPVPMKEIFTPIWENKGVESYIRARVEFHKSAEACADDEILECSPEERWQRPTTYAVIKRGNKRATKVFDSKPNDEQMALFPNCEVVERPGVDAKCMDYCNASIFCHYWKKNYTQIREET